MKELHGARTVTRGMELPYLSRCTTVPAPQGVHLSRSTPKEGSVNQYDSIRGSTWGLRTERKMEKSVFLDGIMIDL